MIKVSVMAGKEGGTIPLEISKFPCGESKVGISFNHLPEKLEYDQINVLMKYESDQDLIDLLLVSDAIKRSPLRSRDFVLLIKYLPYARQDRVCVPGEPHSLKVIGDMINTCGFTCVFVSDPHSDVVEAVVDNCLPLSADTILYESEVIDLDTYDSIVSPDAGAYKKVNKVAQIHEQPVIRADKVRNVSTGEISNIEVYAEDLTGQRVIIVDDICDGGGTFIGLAKKLRERGCEEVDLYVSHGMFTKGVDCLLEEIDTIYCFSYHGSQDDEHKVRMVWEE